MGNKNNGNNGRGGKKDAQHGDTMKQLLNLPADYEFKIMGKTDALDISELVSQMEVLLKEKIGKDRVRKRESSKKKYTSYTVKVYLKTYEELQEIYKLLKANKAVMYYL